LDVLYLICMRLNTNLKSLLWDVDAKKLDAKKHADFLIARIADKGGMKELQWLKKKFGKNKIRSVVKKSRNVSRKTKVFWSVI